MPKTEVTPRQYSLLCHLFECAYHGIDFDEDDLMMTSNDARADAMKVLEILDLV